MGAVHCVLHCPFPFPQFILPDPQLFFEHILPAARPLGAQLFLEQDFLGAQRDPQLLLFPQFIFPDPQPAGPIPSMLGISLHSPFSCFRHMSETET